MAPDPDLYGPPERDDDDPAQEDDWEALIEQQRQWSDLNWEIDTDAGN